MALNPQNLKPAKKGEIRNPNGKPKGIPNTKTRLQRLLSLTENMTNPVTGDVEGFTVAEQMDLAMIMKARKGDTKAYSALVDRLEGKPQQSVDLTTDGESLKTNPNPEQAAAFSEFLKNKTKE